MTAACGVLVALATSTGSAAADSSANDDWAGFGHDSQHSEVSPDTAINATAAPDLSIEWSEAVGGGPVYASPVVVYNATLSEVVVYDVSVGGNSVPSTPPPARPSGQRTSALPWSTRQSCTTTPCTSAMTRDCCPRSMPPQVPWSARTRCPCSLPKPLRDASSPPLWLARTALVRSCTSAIRASKSPKIVVTNGP